eukprot:3653332-Rhodomonas_salina.1
MDVFTRFKITSTPTNVPKFDRQITWKPEESIPVMLYFRSHSATHNNPNDIQMNEDTANDDDMTTGLECQTILDMPTPTRSLSTTVFIPDIGFPFIGTSNTIAHAACPNNT